MQWSPSAQSFFDTDQLVYPSLPNDLIAIDPAQHAALMAGQAAGLSITVGQDGAPVLVQPTPTDPLQAERATMRVRRPQARIAMGPELWSQVLVIAANPLTPWALRVWIEDFSELERLSQTTIDLAAALGLSDAQVDDLFRAAAQITA